MVEVAEELASAPIKQIDRSIWESDIEAEKKFWFSWRQTYDAALKGMNELCWLI